MHEGNMLQMMLFAHRRRSRSASHFLKMPTRGGNTPGVLPNILLICRRRSHDRYPNVTVCVLPITMIVALILRCLLSTALMMVFLRNGESNCSIGIGFPPFAINEINFASSSLMGVGSPLPIQPLMYAAFFTL